TRNAVWKRPMPDLRIRHRPCSVYGEHGHLQQCSRCPLSTLGGGGNRTRVLQYITRASPGAACSAFLSPGGPAGQPPTGSVAVSVPLNPATGRSGGSS